MAPRGRMSTVTITGEHRLHEESMLSYHLISAKPVGIELKTITRQPLMDAVADPTQRRKGTSGDHGFVELMMPRLCRFPVDCAFSMLAYVPFIKGEAGDHTVSPGVISMERGKPYGFALNNLPRCTQVLQFFNVQLRHAHTALCTLFNKTLGCEPCQSFTHGARSDVVPGQQLSHFQLCARRPCS